MRHKMGGNEFQDDPNDYLSHNIAKPDKNDYLIPLWLEKPITDPRHGQRRRAKPRRFRRRLPPLTDEELRRLSA